MKVTPLKKASLLFLSISLNSWGQSVLSYGSFENQTWKKLKSSTNVEFFYTNDYLSNTGGEKSGPRNLGALDLYLSSDFKKFSKLDGEFLVHFTHIDGQNVRGAIGDTQGSSNIEASSQIDRVTDLWYQHAWTPAFNTLVGLHDISSEFNVTESTLNFLNSSFGTSTEISISGAAGSSMYPVTSLGLRNEFKFT